MSKNKYKAKHDEELRLKQEKPEAETAAAAAEEPLHPAEKAHEVPEGHEHSHYHDGEDGHHPCHGDEEEHEGHEHHPCHDDEEEQDAHEHHPCHDDEAEHEGHEHHPCHGDEEEQDAHEHHHHHHHHHHDNDGDDGCCCEHDHEHHHEHSHDHPEESHAHSAAAGILCGDPAHPEGCLKHEHDFAPGDRRVFYLEGLDCPNCAQKIEDAIAGLETVDDVVVTYANCQMRVKAKENRGLTHLLQKTVDAVEDGVTVVERPKTAGGTSAVYILQGLDCPNCAQKIEDHLNTLPEIEEAVITYANTQLRVTARGAAGMTALLQKAVDEVEEGVTVVLREEIRNEEAACEKSADDSLKRSLREIVLGAVIFAVPFAASIAGLTKEGPGWDSLLFVIAYIILGRKVLMTAFANVRKAQMLDENFLMSIATLGVFALGLYNGSWEFEEAVGVMLFYRIGEYFEQKATAQSRSQIMAAVDMRPETVSLVSGDTVRTLKAEEALAGDIVLVRPGDRIPLDGTVAEGESRIDTSPITGEPVPVRVGVGDAVTSGCINVNGTLKVRVDKVLAESMVTKILDSVENAAASKPQIDRFITRFSRVYTPAVVIGALAVALLPSLLGVCGLKLPFIAAANTAEYVEYWITTALTFLVISCPCALVLSVPLAFFSGIGAASRKGILFKGGLAIESLNKVKAVVMDKTGTITKGNFAVQSVSTAAGCDFSEDELLALAAACERTSAHPIGLSITAAAEGKPLTVPSPTEMEELAGRGIRAVINGRTVLTGNRKLMDDFGVSLAEYQGEGIGTEVLVAVDGKIAGRILIADTIKEGAAEAIAKTKALGIASAMLTGDAQDTAEAVAAETGIDEVHARLLPEDKLTCLRQIREKYGPVMFVGDGINDAPVLAGADVGAAMGSGADAAIEAADVVFMTTTMEAIPQALDIARITNRTSWQNVYFALAVKIIVMLLGLAGFANMWLAVFADTGVSMLCLLNSMRILRSK